MSTTQIKRLYQDGKEFVPITLSEAVVVNTTNVPGLNGLGITTLDKVLRSTLATVKSTSDSVTLIQNTLDATVQNINNKLSEKQDKLTAGYGINIQPDADGNLVISANLSFEIYKVAESLPTASAVYANTIYLIPTSGVHGDQDHLEEYLCIDKGNGYEWERLGRIQPETSIDLSSYVTKEEFNTEINTIKGKLADSITAQDVTISSGQSVIVSYTIPNDLYDSLVATGDDDQIITP